jgi:hypothetical protein
VPEDEGSADSTPEGEAEGVAIPNPADDVKLDALVENPVLIVPSDPNVPIGNQGVSDVPLNCADHKMQTISSGNLVIFKKEKITDRVIPSTTLMIIKVDGASHIYTPNNISQVAALTYEKEWMAKVIFSCTEITGPNSSARLNLSLVPEGVEVIANPVVFKWE